ncbi:hypothetical protein C8R43DRAFT_1032144 [Mycena crocata]|nr:hypothetical protein C8R43DRAFT_1032144 [Mycena crocata]
MTIRPAAAPPNYAPLHRRFNTIRLWTPLRLEARPLQARTRPGPRPGFPDSRLTTLRRFSPAHPPSPLQARPPSLGRAHPQSPLRPRLSPLRACPPSLWLAHRPVLPALPLKSRQREHPGYAALPFGNMSRRAPGMASLFPRVPIIRGGRRNQTAALGAPFILLRCTHHPYCHPGLHMYPLHEPHPLAGLLTATSYYTSDSEPSSRRTSIHCYENFLSLVV